MPEASRVSPKLKRTARPDVLILDLALPGLPGLEICRRIRSNENLKRTPIMIVTARRAEVDRVLGLDAGADDYLTKPFSGAELPARVKALLRRSAQPGSTDRSSA
ncbi:MAG: response regulator [Acidobacteriia bacterium]|nr:response regulator [Terriglobia bacterium]